MRALDPEDDSPSPAGPSDSQSSDQSSSKLRQAWDAWTSRPENNAALLQTGLALLQPRSPGQSAVGQFANAVGQGAEASQRNVAGQQEEAKTQADLDIKKREAAARETTAAAYGKQVENTTGKTDKTGLQGALRQQADFRKWLAKPEDTTGLSVDPVVGALQKQFPDIKSKADLLANPAAMAAAKKLFVEQVAAPASDDEEDGGGSSAPQPGASAARAAAPAVPSPQPKIVYDKQGKAYQWDGVQGHPPVPMGN